MRTGDAQDLFLPIPSHPIVPALIFPGSSVWPGCRQQCWGVVASALSLLPCAADVNPLGTLSNPSCRHMENPTGDELQHGVPCGGLGHVSQIPKNIPFPWAGIGTRIGRHNVKLRWPWQGAIAAHSCHPPSSATPILGQRPWLGQWPAPLVPACPEVCGNRGKLSYFGKGHRFPCHFCNPQQWLLSLHKPHMSQPHCHSPSPPQSCPLISFCPLPRAPSVSGCPAMGHSAALRCMGAAGPMRASAGSLAML